MELAAQFAHADAAARWRVRPENLMPAAVVQRRWFGGGVRDGGRCCAQVARCEPLPPCTINEYVCYYENFT